MRETGNRFDPFAVAVISEDGKIIGHVPKLISAAASLFSQYSGSFKCKVTRSKPITRCTEYQCKIKFSWMQRPHEIHENLNPMKITTHTVSKMVGISTSYPLKSPSTKWSWIIGEMQTSCSMHSSDITY